MQLVKKELKNYTSEDIQKMISELWILTYEQLEKVSLDERKGMGYRSLALTLLAAYRMNCPKRLEFLLNRMCGKLADVSKKEETRNDTPLTKENIRELINLVSGE